MPDRTNLTRREWLGTMARAGAGAALLSVVPSWAQGTKPSDRITVASIGTGGMGMGNLRNVLGQSGTQVVAVCDVDRSHAAGAKATVDRRYGNSDCAAYSDFRELLAKHDLDAVVTSLPDHWHAIVAIQAAEAGCDIYGEKPFTHTLREGRALVTTVTRHERIWQTGSWQRSQANFRQACELVRNGRLGKVTKIEIGLPTGTRAKDVTFGDPPPELDYELWLGGSPWAPYCKERVHYNWRHQLDYGGGKLMDWVGHHGDIAHWGMGWDETGPVAIEGVGDFPNEGIYDAAVTYHIQLTYANGTVLHVANSGNAGIRSGCRFINDKEEYIHVDRGRLAASPGSLLKSEVGPDETQLYVSTNHMRNFLEGIRTRRPTITPAETAHRSASIGHLGQIAMRTGRKLRFDPATETILGDPGAAALLDNPRRAPWHL